MGKIEGGYYIKARKIQNSEISVAPPHIREIWDWILKEANHEDTKVCKRGQCIRSYKDIQEGLRWYVGWRKCTYSKNDCETAMKWLTKHTMIHTTKTTRGMAITVLNYDHYQTPENYTENYTENYKKHTRNIQTRHTINNNEKNEKNIYINIYSKEKMKEWSLEFKDKYPNLNIQEEAEKCMDWLSMKGKTFKDYKAFFNNWCRNAVKFSNNGAEAIYTATDGRKFYSLDELNDALAQKLYYIEKDENGKVKRIIHNRKD